MARPSWLGMYLLTQCPCFLGAAARGGDGCHLPRTGGVGSRGQFARGRPHNGGISTSTPLSLPRLLQRNEEKVSRTT